ncbi:hypothetical protein DSUL_80015 [Desulfovibrionales bacterium]
MEYAKQEDNGCTPVDLFTMTAIFEHSLPHLTIDGSHPCHFLP